MNQIESKIRRLSFNQLKALSILCANKNGLVSSTPTGRKIGVIGKSLGGVFSSLARQRISGRPLLIPFGRGDEGRGLRWKLNLEVASQTEIKKIIAELLRSWET